MSRSPEPILPPPAERQDSGFSLVEVIVAIGVLMILMIALLPQLVLGIQTTGTARLLTQAKGVAQGELEKMRNLPYYISPVAGDFRDVLDTYYRNGSTAPGTVPSCQTTGGQLTIPQAGSSGFVASGARCAYEPAGAFYRMVRAGTDFTVVVDTQFLSDATPAAGTPPQPVTPPTIYNSQPSLPSQYVRSQPPSRQIGVTVTVLYRDRATVRAVSTSTQFADRPVADVRVRSEANVTTLKVGSETTQDGPVSLAAGTLNLNGSLNYASTVNATLAATSASVATGAQGNGASASLTAPSASTVTASSTDNGGWLGTQCGLVCWGGTRVDTPSISATDGLPLAGSQATPMQALVTARGGHDGMSFNNSTATDYRVPLQLKPPLLRLDSNAVLSPSGITADCVPGGLATSAYVSAGGYLLTTAATDSVRPSTVESCAAARTSSISLFPTTFAVNGVVVVELTRATARCTVAGAAHTPSTRYDYSAVVKYWNGSAYQAVATIVPGMTSDPLDAVDLTAPVAPGLQLGDYIASWSALKSSEVTATAVNGVAEVTLPGVVTIASQPVRPDPSAPDGLDAASTVSVAIGALGCHAEDRR